MKLEQIRNEKYRKSMNLRRVAFDAPTLEQAEILRQQQNKEYEKYEFINNIIKAKNKRSNKNV